MSQGWPTPPPGWPRPEEPRGEMPGQSFAFISAIVAAMTCCQPMGIAGVILADQAKQAWQRCDEQTARRKLTQSMWCTGIGVAIAVLSVVGYIVIAVVSELVK